MASWGEQTHSNPWPVWWPVRLVFLLGQVLGQWETLCEMGQGGGKWLRNGTQGGLLISQCTCVHPHPHTWTIAHTHHTATCIKPWYLNIFVTILHYTENYNDKEIHLFLRGLLWMTSVICESAYDAGLALSCSIIFIHNTDPSQERHSNIWSLCHLTTFPFDS